MKIYSDINLGVLRHAPKNKKVLDVGCNVGLLGAELKKLGNYVYGIDLYDEVLAIAGKRLDAVKRADISSDGLDIPRDFDTAVLADVLEHLVNPAEALRRVKGHLKNEGEIIISLPNVACYPIRLSLLFGRFNYQESGILDNTHLRFFTKKSARELVESAGFKILKLDVTPYFIRPLFRVYRALFKKNETGRNLEEEVLNSKAFQLYRKGIFPAERFVARLWPELFGYQFIIVARKI